MRKKLLFKILIILLSINVVSANSTPTFWHAEPLAEVLIVDDNTPIEVKSEHLIFDLNNPSVPDNSFWLSGLVSASYEMSNPTDQELVVRMLFPFKDRLDQIRFDLLSVVDNDEMIDYQLLMDYHDYQSDKSILELSGFVRDSLEHDIKLNEQVTLYQLDLSAAERIFFEIDIDYDSAEVMVIGFGNLSGHSYDAKLNHKLSSWLEKDETIYLLVLGGDIQFTVEGYDDYQKKSIKELDYQLQESTVNGEAYLLDFIAKSMHDNLNAKISDQQLLNCLGYYLSNHSNRYIQDWDIIASINQDRLFGMDYQITFEPYQTKQITVSYLINGSMDKTETKTPRYHFEYLLSPAKNWAAFSDLTIDLFTSPDALYVLESSVDFVMIDEGHYQYQTSNLPDSELTFTLYHNETIDFFDRVEHVIYKWQYLIIFVTPLVVGILLLWFILTRFKRRK